MWVWLLFVVLAATHNAKPGLSLQDYEDAVFVALTKDTKGASNPVKFDHEGLDVRGTYDRKGGKFYAEKAGIYWVALGAGANSKTGGYKVGYTLRREGGVYCQLRRDNSNLNGNETFSRDIMISMNSLQTLHMSKDKTPGDKMLYSSDGFETSFSVFRLTGLMTTSVFFCAWRAAGINLSAGQVVTYTTVLVNKGAAFNKATGLFTAPQEGVYFLSFSIGTTASPYPNYMYDMSLRRRSSVLSGIDDNCTRYIRNDWDTISKAGLFHLKKDDIISIQSDKDNTYLSGHSNRSYPNAFSGFLYDPVHGHRKGWSVARKTCWYGPKSLDPVSFDDIIVNMDDNWNQLGNFYSISMDGIYYITVTIGALPRLPIDVKVMIDADMGFAVTSSSTNRDGVQLLSRSAILYLKAGSKVKLRAEKNTGLYSTLDRQTSFTGFLLFPWTARKYRTSVHCHKKDFSVK